MFVLTSWTRIAGATVLLAVSYLAIAVLGTFVIDRGPFGVTVFVLLTIAMVLGALSLFRVVRRDAPAHGGLATAAVGATSTLLYEAGAVALEHAGVPLGVRLSWASALLFAAGTGVAIGIMVRAPAGAVTGTKGRDHAAP